MERNFYIGIAASGAISAGAYSAGVFDFLIQAIEEWERVGEDTGHRVVISAFSGASAGSIVATLGMVGAASSLRADPEKPSPGRAVHYLPTLYEAWVAKPDLSDSKDAGAMLSASDLEKGDLEKGGPGQGGTVFSFLNSLPLENIAQAAIIEAAKSGPIVPKPYFPEELHHYMTLTNLRGVPYAIPFSTLDAEKGYKMMCHADRAHYIFTGAGSHKSFGSPWAAADPGKELDMNSIPCAYPQSRTEWNDIISDTLGSAAFPVGLAGRRTGERIGNFANRAWIAGGKTLKASDIRPDWPEEWRKNNPDDARYEFVSSDGGMLNNDPFEYVRHTLRVDPKEGNEREPDKADRAMIMISPFPDGPEFMADNTKALDNLLLSVIGRIMPVFIANSRFKMDELVLALDNTIASRWMISPSRHVDGEKQKHGIACGLLGGFGGFLEREFREHDYEMGRRNCQDFLARWFGMDQSNRNVMGAAMLPQYPARPELAANRGQAAVIPLRGTAATPVAVRPWPRIDAAKFEKVVEAAVRRAHLLFDRMVSENVVKLGLKLGARAFWHFLGKSKLEDFLRYFILADLVRRDQYAGISLPSQLHRSILAGLISPHANFRTIASLAAEMRFEHSHKEIIKVIEMLEQMKLVEKYDGPRDLAAYTYVERQSGWLKRLPLIRNADDYLGAPIID